MSNKTSAFSPRTSVIVCLAALVLLAGGGALSANEEKEHLAKKALAAQMTVAALKEYETSNAAGSPGYESGREAVRLASEVFAAGDPYGVGIAQTAYAKANEARKAGSKDGCVQMLCDVSARVRMTKLEEVSARLQRMDAVLESGYPTVLKYGAVTSALSDLRRVDEKKTPELVGPVAESVPKVTKRGVEMLRTMCDEGVPVFFVAQHATSLLEFVDRSEVMLKQLGGNLVELMEEKKFPGSDIAVLKGRMLINLAWAARGTGFASTVTEEGWKGMKDRLQEAEEVLTKASEEFPDNARIPATMITVELGQGKGRDRMEKWFALAVKNDPKLREAYSNKIYYLQPRWYGSRKDVLAFGRQCIETGYWDALIPLVFVDASMTLNGANEADFLDEAAWELVRDASLGFLKLHPDSITWRTKYFRYAVRAKKWDVAREQMELLGNNWDRAVLSDSAFRRYRDTVTQTPKAESVE